MPMKKHIAPLLFFVSLTTACAPALKKEGEVVLGEGEIKAITTQKLLIQEKTSVVTLDYDDSSGRYLSDRYKAGESIKLLGTKSLDEQGNSSEQIRALIFADGARFNIASN